MDSIKDFLTKTGKIEAGRVQIIADILHRNGQRFANAGQLEGVSESLLFGGRYAGLSDGEVTTILNAAKPQAGANSSGSMDRVEEMLSPLRQMCIARIAQSRTASKICDEDLRLLREALKTVVIPKSDTEPRSFPDALDDRMELERMQDVQRTLQGWLNQSRHLLIKDVRGTVLRLTVEKLQFPVTAANDLLVILRSYANDVANGGVIGIELEKKLTTKGLRQSEVEFYLWANVSYFPFIQIITDMESGGFAYYALPGKTEDGRTVIVREPFVGMDSLKTFFLQATKAIPAQLGTIDDSGNLLLPDTLSEPSRKRKRASDSGSGGGAGNGGGSNQQSNQQLAGMMMLINLLEAAQEVPNPNDIEDSADDYVFDLISDDGNPLVVRPELQGIY